MHVNKSNELGWYHFATDFYFEEDVDFDKLDLGNFCINELDIKGELYALIDNLKINTIENIPPRNRIKKLLSPLFIAYYENDESFLNSKQNSRLDSFLNSLIPFNVDSIIITGHADEKNTFEYNLVLSGQRARNIYEIMRNKFKNNIINYYYEGKSYTESVKNKWFEKGRRVDIKVIYKNNELIPWYKIYQNCSSADEMSYLKNDREARKINNDPLEININQNQKKDILKQYIDARKLIYKKSKEVEIVMINEEHHIPFYRQFTEDLLDTLFKNGYYFLAVEGLVDANDLNSLTYKDPSYKLFLEKAKYIGFKLISYDVNLDKDWDIKKENIDTSIFSGLEFYYKINSFQMNKRDYNQYLNLQDYLSEISPSKKILIYCGYGHLVVNRVGKWWPLGYYLKRDYGNRLLSIDQVQLNQCQDIMQNEFINYLKPSKSIILISKNELFIQKEYDPILKQYIKNYDMQILHPDTKSKASKGLKTIVFDNLKNEYKYPILILTYQSEDNRLTDIAFDIKEINTIKDSIEISVPHDYKYQLVIKDRNNKLIYYGVNNK